MECFTSIQNMNFWIHCTVANWRLIVPVNYIEEVLREVHKEASSGSFGKEKTYERIAREFYWPGITLM